MSATLTPEEIGEIAEFARTHPQYASAMLECKDPQVLLARVRETLQEEACVDNTQFEEKTDEKV